MLLSLSGKDSDADSALVALLSSQSKSSALSVIDWFEDVLGINSDGLSLLGEMMLMIMIMVVVVVVVIVSVDVTIYSYSRPFLY